MYCSKLTFSSDIISFSWFLDILARWSVSGSLVGTCWPGKAFWFCCTPPRASAMRAAAVIAEWRPIGCRWKDSPWTAWPPSCFWGSVMYQLKRGKSAFIPQKRIYSERNINTNQRLLPFQVHHGPAIKQNSLFKLINKI